MASGNPALVECRISLLYTSPAPTWCKPNRRHALPPVSTPDGAHARTLFQSALARLYHTASLQQPNQASPLLFLFSKEGACFSFSYLPFLCIFYCFGQVLIVADHSCLDTLLLLHIGQLSKNRVLWCSLWMTWKPFLSG